MILRDVEPRIGRYGEQELRAILTKFKSLSHDNAGTDQEEEVRAYTTPADQSISNYICTYHVTECWLAGLCVSYL
jgi:hypothetical protein